MGVMLYIMITGTPPFFGPHNTAIQESILKGEIGFAAEIWGKITPECKDLVQKILVPAEKRLIASQVLEHPWLKNISSKTVDAFPSTVTKQLRRFRKFQRVKQAALAYLATQLSEDELRPLRLLFLKLDKNGDGLLSTEEVLSALKAHPKKDSLESIVGAMDTNGSGFIEYNGLYLIVN